MNTLKSIWNVAKLFLVIPLEIIAGLIMLCSILVFALATLIDSPSKLKLKWVVALTAIKGIWKSFFEKIKEDRLNKQYNGTL